MELYFPLILDGANGTELQKRGYYGSKCTEAWVLEHPEVMKQLQKEYIEAGSDIVYAPTFGANRVKLEENGFFNMVKDFNKRLVEISKEAAAGKALVAGDIATSGKFLAPLGDISFSELYDMYHEQAEAMEEAGVDMFVIETIMTVPDARAALLAVKDVSDKPVLVSFTCDENGRTLTGSDVRAALVIMQGMG
ncbi:MAG: homocysteine S-methyltransferase family protein, partial [Mogibacterium sp.]|nr:homocysteine S-methyltransferase family protein [Mogibacterium sp.]